MYLFYIDLNVISLSFYMLVRHLGLQKIVVGFLSPNIVILFLYGVILLLLLHICTTREIHYHLTFYRTNINLTNHKK